MSVTLCIICLLFKCRKGYLDIVSFLITSCGASVLATDNDEYTPLHDAWYVLVSLARLSYPKREKESGESCTLQL